MALDFRQTKSVEATAGTTAPGMTLTFGSVNVANSVWVADVFWNNAAGTMSVASNSNGTWAAVGTAPIRGAGGLAAWSFQQFWVANPSSTGIGTVNATPTVACSTGLHIREYTGFTGTPQINGSQLYNDVNANPAKSGTATTSAAPAVVIAACFSETTVDASGGTVSSGNTFTDRAPGGDTNWGAGGYCEAFTTVNLTGGSVNFTNEGGDNLTGIYAIADVSAGAAVVSIPVLTMAPPRA